MRHWLMKSEPDEVSIDDLAAMPKQTVAWYGVRNYQARNYMRDEMRLGDQAFFYHSNEGKAVVGVARVAREAYPDPTSEDDWSAVDIEPVRALARPVTLDELRSHPVLGKMMVFRRPRLSVVPVTPEEYELVLALSKKP